MTIIASINQPKRTKWDVHGYAIISSNDCIADANGDMPTSLHNDADWAYFQSELAKAKAIILGRAAHEATPNRAGRLRIIMSRSVSKLEQRTDGWWWNPADLSFVEMAETVIPQGGRIAVPGGRGPFDWFLRDGFDGFHLARAHHVELIDGAPVFSDIAVEMTADTLLAKHGMIPEDGIVLDRCGPVTMQVWRKG